tara:strand:+ start:59807 stop:60169 length:363 start_codon:yes stop_codon:yes gene_type:complete
VFVAQTVASSAELVLAKHKRLETVKSEREKLVEKLVEKHSKLNQTDNAKVVSHVQREEKDGDWIRHTIMLEGIDVPFIYRRKHNYKSLTGARVNLTYYRHVEEVAGIEFETMKVVRVKRS